METKIKWHVGQPVWDKTISKNSGKIENINNHVEKYPIIVNFSGFKQSYTIDGKLALDVLVPTLSTKPYEIKMEGFSQEIEEELPKKGQVVWARDEDEYRWVITHFIEKVGGLYVCSSINDENVGSPYDTITTKNPYTVKEEVSILETTDREPKVGDMVYAWGSHNPIVWVVCGELKNVDVNENSPYTLNELGDYKHCSLKNPLIK